MAKERLVWCLLRILLNDTRRLPVVLRQLGVLTHVVLGHVVVLAVGRRIVVAAPRRVDAHDVLDGDGALRVADACVLPQNER